MSLSETQENPVNPTEEYPDQFTALKKLCQAAEECRAWANSLLGEMLSGNPKLMLSIDVHSRLVNAIRRFDQLNWPELEEIVIRCGRKASHLHKLRRHAEQVAMAFEKGEKKKPDLPKLKKKLEPGKSRQEMRTILALAKNVQESSERGGRGMILDPCAQHDERAMGEANAMQLKAARQPYQQLPNEFGPQEAGERSEADEFRRIYEESQKYKKGPRSKAKRTEQRDELIAQAISVGMTEPEQIFEFIKGQDIELVKRGKSFINPQIMMKKYWERQRAKDSENSAGDFEPHGKE
jgi:hypothetical protein